MRVTWLDPLFQSSEIERAQIDCRFVSRNPVPDLSEAPFCNIAPALFADFDLHQ
jgi:hypothetical protein